ncbi:RNA polymerase II subunit A C-terminal domain phosphatase-like isoform X2 [Rhodnius prolixus]
MSDTRNIFLTLRKSVKLTKWKVEEGTIIYDGRVLLLYEETDSGKSAKLKSKNVGSVSKLLVKEGDVVNPGDALLEIAAGCSHPTVINDLCAECGADLQREGETQSRATVPMVHSIPQLKVSQEQAQKLGHKDTERLLRDRKLVLLVDLDQTLIHTTHDNIPNNLKDVHHFQLPGSPNPWYHTRLRPGTDRFLLNMSRFYELHICTFGVRPYAHTVAAILDKDRRLFSNRILSRDEFFDPNSKLHNLQALFPCGDELVCIIDDREDVWDNSPNLIQVKPYHFFAVTADINDILSRINRIKDNSYLAPGVRVKEKKIKNKKRKCSDEENGKGEMKVVEEDSEDNKSEEDSDLIDFEDEDDYLLHLEDILIRLHRRFYSIYDKKEEGIADVKWVIEQERSAVLRGCTLVLSGLVPLYQDGVVSPEPVAPAAKIAAKLGAKLAQDLTSETTHLVAANRCTAKVHQAKKMPHIKVVNPHWLAACAHRWEKVEEALFEVGTGGPLPFPAKFEKRSLLLFQNETPAFLSLSKEDMDAMNQEIEEDSEGEVTDKEEDVDSGPETSSQSGNNSDAAEGGDDMEEWSELGREIEKGLSDCL